jgi:small subunit ribosomal protein S1
MSDNLAPVDTTAVPPQQEPVLAVPEVPAAAPEAAHEAAPVAPEAPPAAASAAPEAPHQAAPAAHEAPPAAPVGPETARPGMGHILGEDYAYQQSKRGEIRLGHVIAIKEEGIVVDLGLKREGFVPQDDVRQVPPDALEALKAGDEIPVYVLRPENDREGNVLVSWHRARQEQDWVDAQKLHDTAAVWEGKVKGYNRGGLIVPFGKIRGFVPASQITGVSRRLDATSLQARLAEMVGQDLPFKVIEVDRENRRLILSERTARREWRTAQREKLLAELQEGDIVPGVVRNICDFGIFVDLGGTDGLVHVSELSWRRTTHPSEVVQVGDKVNAYVLRVDRENRRIGLSLRLASPDPWTTVEERYQIGDMVTGTITKLIAFGAFAALDDGIEGLVHISELADLSPRHPSEVVNQDQVLPLCIVKIDSQRRRIGLSLKRVTAEQRAEWEASHQAPAAEEAEAEPAAEPLVEQPQGEAQPAEMPIEQPQVAEAPVEQPESEVQPAEPPIEQPQAAEASVEQPESEAQPAEAPVEEPVSEVQPEEPPVEESAAGPVTAESEPSTPPDESPAEAPAATAEE